ncbi:hypothetical protein [Pseudomonas sp. NPDC008258]|uniref:hypothetical protein n=1 Tax=Pseudomonas sp. NPDC008258 TaxID=3364418 RepID=UPI0036EA8A1F
MMTGGSGIASKPHHTHYQAEVIDHLQDAGIVDPTLGMRLLEMDQDKREYALRQLESRYQVRLRRDAAATVHALAEELGRALILR